MSKTFKSAFLKSYMSRSIELARRLFLLSSCTRKSDKHTLIDYQKKNSMTLLGETKTTDDTNKNIANLSPTSNAFE